MLYWKKKRNTSNTPKRIFGNGILCHEREHLYTAKKKFIEAGGFDERISIFEDLALDLKFMNICIYAYTPEIVYEHYCEYAELSLTPKPLNKFFPYYIQITNQSFF